MSPRPCSRLRVTPLRRSSRCTAGQTGSGRPGLAGGCRRRIQLGFQCRLAGGGRQRPDEAGELGPTEDSAHRSRRGTDRPGDLAMAKVALAALGFDGIQRRDPGERLLCDRIRLCPIQVEELPPRMRQAAQLRDALGEQRFVAAKAVHHQRAFRMRQKVLRMPAIGLTREQRLSQHQALLWPMEPDGRGASRTRPASCGKARSELSGQQQSDGRQS